MMVASRVLLPLRGECSPRAPQTALTLRGVAQRMTKLERLVFVPPYNTLFVLDIVFRPKNPRSVYEETCTPASTLFPDKVAVGSEQDVWHLLGFPSRVPATAFREDVPANNLPSYPVLYEGDVVMIRVACPAVDSGTATMKEAYAHFVASVLTEIPGSADFPFPSILDPLRKREP